MSKSAERLKKDIIDHLYWDLRIDASDIEIEIQEGEIIIKGTVSDYKSLIAAEIDTWNVEGVKSVDNRLKVNLPSFITPPGDKKLKKNIETVLEINRDIDISDLELSVSNGIVILDGFVDAYWKKVKAETIVYDVVGVGDIVNNLTIVPTENYIDKDIAHDISSAIKRNFKVNVDDLDIKVNNGKVYISGLVSDREAYIAAIESVENTAGVISIEDNIMIGE